MGIGRFYQPEAQTFAPAPIPVDIRSIGILEQDRRDRYDKTFDDLIGLGEEYDAEGRPIWGAAISESPEAVQRYKQGVSDYREKTNNTINEFIQTNDIQEAKKRISALKAERNSLVDQTSGEVGILTKHYRQKSLYEDRVDQVEGISSLMREYYTEVPTEKYIKTMQDAGNQDISGIEYPEMELQGYVDPASKLSEEAANWQPDETTFSYDSGLYTNYGVKSEVEEPEIFAKSLDMAYNDQSVSSSIKLDVNSTIWDSKRGGEQSQKRIKEAVDAYNNNKEFRQIAESKGVESEDDLEGLMTAYVAVKSAEFAAEKHSYKKIKQFNKVQNPEAIAAWKARQAQIKKENAVMESDRMAWLNKYKTTKTEKELKTLETLKNAGLEGRAFTRWIKNAWKYGTKVATDYEKTDITEIATKNRLESLMEHGTESEKKAALDFELWLDLHAPEYKDKSWGEAFSIYEESFNVDLKETTAIMSADEKTHVQEAVFGTQGTTNDDGKVTEEGFGGLFTSGRWMDAYGNTEQITTDEVGMWKIAGDQVFKRASTGELIMGITVENKENGEKRVWVPELTGIKTRANMHPYSQKSNFIGTNPNFDRDELKKYQKQNSLTTKEAKNLRMQIGRDGKGSPLGMVKFYYYDDKGNEVEDYKFYTPKVTVGGEITGYKVRDNYTKKDAIYDVKANMLFGKNFSGYKNENLRGQQEDKVTGETYTSSNSSTNFKY